MSSTASERIVVRLLVADLVDDRLDVRSVGDLAAQWRCLARRWPRAPRSPRSSRRRPPVAPRPPSAASVPKPRSRFSPVCLRAALTHCEMLCQQCSSPSSSKKPDRSRRRSPGAAPGRGRARRHAGAARAPGGPAHRRSWCRAASWPRGRGRGGRGGPALELGEEPLLDGGRVRPEQAVRRDGPRRRRPLAADRESRAAGPTPPSRLLIFPSTSMRGKLDR